MKTMGHFILIFLKMVGIILLTLLLCNPRNGFNPEPIQKLLE